MAKRSSRAGRARDRARDALEESLRQLEKQLPKNLSRMVRQLRANLKTLQAQVERLRADSDQRWNRIQTQVRTDAARLFRRLEHAIEPKAARKPGRTGRSAARKPRAAARPRTAKPAAAPRVSEPEPSAQARSAPRLPLAAAPLRTEARPIGEPPRGTN